MSAEPRTLVDTISEAESQYQEAAELIKNTSEQTEHVADALLETYDRNLDPDDLAYVDLDNPASELFKHLEVEIPEYEHAFEFKPSPWPTSLWLNEMHRTLVDETPGIRGDLTDPLESIFSQGENPAVYGGRESDTC